MMMLRCLYVSECVLGGVKWEWSAGSGRASASGDAGGLETLMNEFVVLLWLMEMSEIW